MHSVHMSAFRVLTKARARTAFKLGALNNDQAIKTYDIVKDIINNKLNTPLEDMDTNKQDAACLYLL